MKLYISLESKNHDQKQYPSEVKPERAGEEDAENLRTEYKALTRFFGETIKFRFTTTTIFLAAVGLIVKEGLYPSSALLLLAVTMGMWIVEIRNRALYYCLAKRAMEIEGDWGFFGKKAYMSWFRLMFKPDLSNKPKTQREYRPLPPDINAPERPEGDAIRVIGSRSRYPNWLPKRLYTHTVGFDIVYGAVALFALWHIVCNILDPSLTYLFGRWFFGHPTPLWQAVNEGISTL